MEGESLVVGNTSYTYRELVEMVPDVPSGSVVGLLGGFDAPSVAALLSLWRESCIVVPMLRRDEERLRIAQAEYVLEDGCLQRTGIKAAHPLYGEIEGAGLVLFTSGSSGTPKAVVHNMERWFAKLARPGKRQRTLAFLSFDHVGGLNTLLYALANGSTIVVPEDRSPAAVWRAINEHRVELLPTTPTFLRLALLDGPIPSLPSLRLVSYGSEPMPLGTLEAIKAALPNVEFRQQFGMSEVGVLRSQGADSTWVRLEGARVVDGLLEVRSSTTMLGYLNAPSPFTADGWLRTGDEAEQHGDLFRVLGRRSETINVGGEKVHPADVESRLEALDGVAHAVVRGEPNPLVGHAVVARVVLSTDESIEEFRSRMQSELKSRLPRYAIPQRVERLTTAMGDRGKKLRAA